VSKYVTLDFRAGVFRYRTSGYGFVAADLFTIVTVPSHRKIYVRRHAADIRKQAFPQDGDQKGRRTAPPQKSSRHAVERFNRDNT
jgi:hypothetical protein